MLQLTIVFVKELSRLFVFFFFIFTDTIKNIISFDDNNNVYSRKYKHRHFQTTKTTRNATLAKNPTSNCKKPEASVPRLPRAAAAPPQKPAMCSATSSPKRLVGPPHTLAFSQPESKAVRTHRKSAAYHGVHLHVPLVAHGDVLLVRGSCLEVVARIAVDIAL